MQSIVKVKIAADEVKVPLRQWCEPVLVEYDVDDVTAVGGPVPNSDGPTFS